jgi:hypothetical protein
MTNGEVFSLGTKWIGVYCLAGVTGGLFVIFPLTATPNSFLVFEWSGALSLIHPAVFLTMGIYLLKDGSYLRKLALHDNDGRIKNSQDFFDIAVRLFGLYQIVGIIPDCLWILANVLIVLRAEPILSVRKEMEAIQSNAVSSLATLLLGVSCLLWIGRFTGLIFRPQKGKRRLSYGERNE